MDHSRIALTLVAGGFVGLGSQTVADEGDLLATFDHTVSKFAVNPVNDHIYASLPDLNAVGVYDAESLALVTTVPTGPDPRGLSVSPDGSLLYVATAGTASLDVVDTSTLQVIDTLPAPAQPSDVRIGLENRLYVTPASQGSGIMQIDAVTGEFQGAFNFSVFIYANGMLEISPDRTSLYFANVGLSPGTLAKFDVSTPTPSLLGRNPHGALGSNGQDLALSHAGDLVSYACGSGNGPGYSIYVLDTDVVGVSHLVSLILAWGDCGDCPEDLDDSGVVDVSDLSLLIANWGNFPILGSLETGAYPREMTFSPDDLVAYAVHTSGEIDVFDTTTYLPLSTMATSGEARELIVDRTGGYLFAAFDSELRVYDTGR